MSNPFEALALPISLSIAEDDIEDSWRRLSQQFHPDVAAGESGEISSEINQARELLLNPASRLEEWLKAKGREPGLRNSAISDDLMTLFSSVGDGLRKADTSIEALKKAQTAIAKSLMMPGAIAAQKNIQKRLGEIKDKISAITDRFPGYEKSADHEAAVVSLSELKFLEKWQRECQQRLLELIAID